MNNLVLKEKQEFMGIQIPVIEGGFGEKQKVVLAKTVAEIHGVETKYINKLINNNIERFGVNDLVDIKGSSEELLNLEFTAREKANYKNIFLLSQRGYTKLVAMMDNSNDKKWDVMNNLIDDYFNMKVELKERQPNLEGLSPQLQALINIELQQKKLDEKIEQVREESKSEIQAMRNVVAINSNDWKNDCKKLITKIAYELGGISHINDVYKEVYSTLNKRMKTKLNVRLTNKRRRMADEGVCKSKRDKLNYINVIEDDCKLIEGYVAIVKEMAIKYGVA